MSLSDIVASVGRRVATTGASVVDIITFVEADWGLGMALFPVQRIILKAHYGIALDDNPFGFPLDAPIPLDHPAYDPSLVDVDGYYKLRVVAADWRRENEKFFTEAEYLKYLHVDKRCNIDRVIPGVERRELVLSIGRRAGKTTLSACIAAYETYKLVSKGHPQRYYGLPDANVIQIVSVATDKDQAGLLYREVQGHFLNCGFFGQYLANQTQSFATFQTPYDIEAFGPFSENPRARFSIKVTFRSCVAKGLRGAGNIVVILDEVAHFTDDGQSSAESVYKAVTPSTTAFTQKDPRDLRKALSKMSEGRIILISSPMGRQGQFYKLFQLGMQGGRASENMLCIEAPTWEVNPTVPPNEYEKHYVKDPNVFFTEYGGRFSDRTSGWISTPADLFACVDPQHTMKTSAPSRFPHYMGVDVALVGDYTAAAVGHIDGDKVVLDFIDRIKAGEGKFAGQERLEFDDVADWIADIARRFYISDGMFDQWSGIPMEQALAKRGMSQLKSVHHTKTLSSQMFQHAKNMLLDRRLVLFDHPSSDASDHEAYLEELLELQAEIESKYVIKVAAPNIEGKHDDYSDAFVRMLWVASQHAAGKTIIIGSRFGSGTPSLISPSSGRASTAAFARTRRTGSVESRMVPRPGRPGTTPFGRFPGGGR